MRLLITLALIVAFAFFGATVKLGKYTLFGHVRRIWHTEEVQDLKDGVQEKAGPAVHRVERGIEAGYNAMKSDAATGSAAPATP